MPTTIHLEVRGRVQGVGFRWFVREEAIALGLSGWVRNRRDGAVELTAAGPEHALRKLFEIVRKGPPGAHVTEVIEHSPPPAGDALPSPFAIDR